MKRFGTMLAWISLGIFAAGCGGGGVEVGPSTEPAPSGGPSHFREAMEKADGKMMKKPTSKGSAGTTK
jgi:hypothetical protein